MATILAAAVSLPALFVADGYVAADYTVDQRAQESTSRLVAEKDITSSALLAEQLYVSDPDFSDIPQELLRGVVGTEPQATEFSVLIDENRILGDVTNNGLFQAFDSSQYTGWVEGTLTNQTYIDYIENVLNPYIVKNLSKYLRDEYVADGYMEAPRRAHGYALLQPELVRDQDTIGIFPVSSTLAGPELTQAAGAQSDVTSTSFAASFRIESTGMAASATSTTIMPFGMLEDAAAVSSKNKNTGEFYTASGYVVAGYVEDSSDLYSNSLAAAEIVRNGHFIPVASSATDIGVTQVHALGAAVEAVITSKFAGSRIESTGYLSSASATTLIPMTRVKETGYKTDGTSATDAGASATKSVGAQSRSGLETSKVTELITKAAAGAEPESSLLNTEVQVFAGGVLVYYKVGDITRNGSVTAADATKYSDYLAGTLGKGSELDHIRDVLHPWLTENAPELLKESYSLIAGNFTAGFGAQIDSQSTTPTAGEMTASFGVKVEGDATTIIAPRLKWETVSEPSDIWTTINDDSYPFG